MILVRILVFAIGAAIVGGTFISAIRTFVLPRGASDIITRGVFLYMRRVFDLYNNRVDSYEARDRAMALFAPFSLIALSLTWLALVDLGYVLMYWASGIDDLNNAFLLSGSSLLTLGFAATKSILQECLAFSEAAIGLILVALLISYLPTMYSAFSKREAAVTLLSVRAGEPPSATELLSRYARIQGIEQLHALWESWELWFSEIEENHTSLAPLVFFRSPQSNHSWVTAAGAVLDAASLQAAVIDVPRDAQAELTIRAGYLALRNIADFFGIEHPANPRYPDVPISIAKDEFLQACAVMRESGVPLKEDLEAAWLAYAGWRVNYDVVLLGLATLTMAPYAPWSSDRGLPARRPPKRFKWGARARQLREEL